MTARLRIVCACGLFALSGRGLWAQISPNTSGPIVGRVDAPNAPEGPRPGLIVNEPYSATTERENHKTLADGTHIEEKRAPEEKDFRDSQGRTRRERYNPRFGGDAPMTLQSILINDPLEGVEYYLVPQSHLACQGSPHWVGFTNQGGTAQCVFTSPSSGQAQPVTGRIIAPPTTPSPNQRPRNKNVVEDLGTQLMEGLTVSGTRTTMTIPAGAQGNDRPLENVSERWFSKELNIYVLIKNSDPRNGETTLRTTNIDRSEPDPSLFRVPPDYTTVRQ